VDIPEIIVTYNKKRKEKKRNERIYEISICLVFSDIRENITNLLQKILD
jgi:hypothetical protein